MATPQLSPGVLVREVDLTVGRAENVLDNIGAIAGPFSIGPVEEPINISNEQQLLQVFGRPSSKDNEYEYWMSASSYLSYGGVLKVVRTNNDSLNNSNVARESASVGAGLTIKNFDDYTLNYSNETQPYYFASKNPGTWANGLKVCYIDDVADQIIGLGITNPSSLGLSVGVGVTTPLVNISIPGDGVTEVFNGYLKGIVTEIQENLDGSNLSIKILSRVSSDGTETPTSYNQNNSFASIERGDTLYFNDSSGDLIGLANPQGFILDFTFSGGSVLGGEADETYSGVSPSVGGTGNGATFNIKRDDTGAIEEVTIVNGGSGYNAVPGQNDQLLIPGSLIGGGGSVGIVTFTPSPLPSEANATYTGVTGTTSPGGVPAIFDIQRDGSGNIINIDIVEPGTRYAVGDTITILGSNVGGDDITNDVTITIDGINDNDSIIISVSEVAEPTELSVTSIRDWYNQQTLGLENSVVFWRSIADKPITSSYALERNGSNDGLHIVVVDDTGDVTRISGNILEKHLNLSKARDAVSAVNSPTRIWYKDYLANFSNYIFAGRTPSGEADTFHQTSPKATGFSNGFVPFTISDGIWGQEASNTTFSSIGNKTYNLLGGSDYGSGGPTLSNLVESYKLFENKDEIDVNFLIYGPSMSNIVDSQTKANKLISIANSRKDCIAVISPHKGIVVPGNPNSNVDGIVGSYNSEQQTNNIIKFFAPLSSSSYAVFDSGYKYTFDRFNNQFRYIPCNADIAGLMARTTLTSFPWFSPAGQQRGILNNAIKLAYNPNKDQRDRLYTARVNSIINQPGIGILLFGDKTALGFASAFDRINVRRLFLTVQRALQSAADAQLFELNDEITRSNFVNIVEPFLRDIQAKRGVFDFRVICDASNNTPEVIDNNEFRADIFLKPARSINYITLTFVATRTGVSFEEVAGNV
jgi:hypothetical protein